MPRSDLERSDLLQLVFGVACDPAADGTRLQIGRMPRCPWCDAAKIENWEATEPPRMVEVDIRHVTHVAWRRLTDLEKVKVVADAVEEIRRS
ncbi:hypothetical protein [Blastopirellula retiformator]|uniref:hypothetical protein n=1 Tax=Blastopirellula retiformator TaxID=2527970 RepID=UPI0011B4839F|nr:hypothetical protein [Blastopirellula retiformator]